MWPPQVREQLEALLAEKARLASENAQLQRANHSLQELLEYSMSQHIAQLEASDRLALPAPHDPESYADSVDDGAFADQSDEDAASESLFDKIDD